MTFILNQMFFYAAVGTESGIVDLSPIFAQSLSILDEKTLVIVEPFDTDNTPIFVGLKDIGAITMLFYESLSGRELRIFGRYKIVDSSHQSLIAYQLRHREMRVLEIVIDSIEDKHIE